MKSVWETFAQCILKERCKTEIDHSLRNLMRDAAWADSQNDRESGDGETADGLRFGRQRSCRIAVFEPAGARLQVVIDRDGRRVRFPSQLELCKDLWSSSALRA